MYKQNAQLLKMASPHDRADAYIDRKVTRDYQSTGSHCFRGSQLALAMVDSALLNGAPQPIGTTILKAAASFAKPIGSRSQKH